MAIESEFFVDFPFDRLFEDCFLGQGVGPDHFNEAFQIDTQIRRPARAN